MEPHPASPIRAATSRRVLGVVLRAAIAVIAVGVLAPVAAQAAPASQDPVGWLRLTPAKGATDAAVDALTEAGCSKGDAVVVAVTGPGIPKRGDVGYIVGNTAMTALEHTESGQLYVPLSLTFRDWFADNAPGVHPHGVYTLSLVCRDRLRSSLTYGAYVARVEIRNNSYVALGEAGRPLDAPTRGGPNVGVTPAPDPPAPDPSNPVSRAPGPGAGSTGATPSTEPAPAATAEGPVPLDAQPAAATTTPSGALWVAVALAVIALVAVVVVAVLRRPAPDPNRTRHRADN